MILSQGCPWVQANFNFQKKSQIWRLTHRWVVRLHVSPFDPWQSTFKTTTGLFFLNSPFALLGIIAAFSTHWPCQTANNYLKQSKSFLCILHENRPLRSSGSMKVKDQQLKDINPSPKPYFMAIKWTWQIHQSSTWMWADQRCSRQLSTMTFPGRSTVCGVSLFVEGSTFHSKCSMPNIY